MPVPLSLLEQVPVFDGSTAVAAATEAAALGVAAEAMGFSRFWVAEHHRDPTRGCASPEVVAAFVAARTTTIRVGAGCVLLPYTSPLRAAEQYNALNALANGRADLGVGRGMASPTVPDEFASHTADLLAMLQDPATKGVVPADGSAPQVWLMAAGERGALTASALGLPLALAQFAHDRLRDDLADLYRSGFRPSWQCPEPRLAVAVRVNCAETEFLARRLALAVCLPAMVSGRHSNTRTYPSLQDVLTCRWDRSVDDFMTQHPYVTVAGTPHQVTDQLVDIAQTYQASEIVLTTTCPGWDQRNATFQLICDAWARLAPAQSLSGASGRQSGQQG